MNSIMIVGVAAFTRLTMRNMFESLGFEVIAEADSVEEALKNYRLYRPKLVLMDISMTGMDGLSASRKIIEFDRDANIIMCSAIVYRETVIQAIRSGAKDFIAKPLQKERIELSIQKVLGEKEEGWMMPK
ncbi:response regulator [Brevibacillus choshinensis]|uniref:response regulator n=1 Tax=Brevibacillus choshinensis TaxID=54911 RepID=UPI002E21DEAC|nr:response regulator [Brevibacillus choshinensis]MED4583009.1 response regulator [Brevibacillus choshinensis]MED4752925.1 response regulator [Brevibacillus choshinensis]MED4781499.1 response regulator [Brevibacillus choshinensis]